jgi:hypothetical protein
MAATKARTAIWTGQTLTAGAGNTTSATQNLSTSYGSQVNIKLTNGATGPTVPAQVQVQVANDAAATLVTNFGGPMVGSASNNAIIYFSVEIPIGVEAVILVAGSNTGQNVTVDADISQVTAI